VFYGYLPVQSHRKRWFLKYSYMVSQMKDTRVKQCVAKMVSIMELETLIWILSWIVNWIQISTLCRSDYNILFHRCNVHGEPEEEECEICGKMFASKQQVSQHTRLVHSDQTFKCDICGQEFNSKRSLQDHLNKHNGTKAYTCKCGRTYQYASGLNRHKQGCQD